MPSTLRLGASPEDLYTAAELLRQGKLVSIPTETVYGLAADAASDDAVAGIYAAKGRPSFNPLIAHVSDLAMAERYADFPAEARLLAEAFWPGPLTIILPFREDARLSPVMTAGLKTVGLRVPDHALTHALIAAFDGALAAPSANISGRISPTEPSHVLEGLDGRIGAVIDGGPCDIGVESTIIAVDPDGTLRLLRPGGIAAAAVKAATGLTLSENTPSAGIEAPGQMTSHYAPVGTMRLNATQAEEDEILLGFGPVASAHNLSPTGNLAEAAANLFRMMHRLDVEGVKKIAVSPIPSEGIGLAINDRLKRAAAPRH